MFSSLLHYNFSALLFFHTSSYISFLISVITSSINSFSHRLPPFLFCPFFHYFFSLFSFSFFFLTFHTTLLSLVCPPVFARVPSNLHPQYEKLLKEVIPRHSILSRAVRVPKFCTTQLYIGPHMQCFHKYVSAPEFHVPLIHVLCIGR